MKCLTCGKEMYQVRDNKTNTYTGHLWRCDCMPKNMIISVG